MLCSEIIFSAYAGTGKIVDKVVEFFEGLSSVEVDISKLKSH